MLSAVARWRILFVICLVSSIGGCRRGKVAAPAVSPPIAQPSPAGVAFQFTIENRTSQADSISVIMDGASIAEKQLGPGKSESFSFPAAPGWHTIQTLAANGVAHQAVVQADKPKWILIRREPHKREGIGFHVTEYRRRP